MIIIRDVLQGSPYARTEDARALPTEALLALAAQGDTAASRELRVRLRKAVADGVP